jgi:hypothetical protein
MIKTLELTDNRTKRQKKTKISFTAKHIEIDSIATRKNVSDG